MKNHDRPTIPARALFGEESEPNPATLAWLNRAGEALDPRPGFILASRRRIQSGVSGRYGRNPWLMWKWSAVYWWQSPVLHVALVVLLAAVGYFNVAGISQAAQYAIPGDWLYPVKTAGESLRLAASLTAEKDTRLHIAFARRRLLEAQSLAFENRYDRIPETVADFDYHVTRAVILVGWISPHRPAQARGLTGELEQAVIGQVGMVDLLHGFTPDTTRIELKRMISISTDGVTAARLLSRPGSGGEALGRG